MQATWIALFRGINVGGRNILPMKQFVPLLNKIGAEDVRTYIQSGNVVFRHDETDTEKLVTQLRTAVAENAGFSPEVLLLSAQSFSAIAACNPYPPASTTHVFFLAARPADPDVATLDDLAAPSEQFELDDQALFLHAPDGLARSKLAARVERTLGVGATARNGRTVTKIQSLVADLA
jgi:uncharacterized protein (DUF1697 family)